MQQLAAAIRHDIAQLVDRYDAELRQRPGYDHLPEALRRELERRVLSLIADCLEAGNHAALLEYVQQRAAQWETLGFPLAWFQQALIIPEEILTPLISSVGAGNFLWQALNRSQGVVWQLLADQARQTEDRFRSIVETSHSGVVIIDAAFHVTYVNDELVQISGYSREELLGDDFRHLLDAKSQQVVAHHYLRRQRGEDAPPRYEIAFVRKDGVKRYVEMSAVALTDLNGKPYTVAQVLDVSERKQTEQALRASQQLLQSVMDNIPQAVFWKDQDLRYLGCNQAFAEDAGLATPQHIVGKTDYDMPWTAQAEAYRADDHLVMESGTAKINYEEAQTTPTGDLIWLRTSKVPMRDAEGKVTAVLGMYEDITERREAEETLSRERNLLRTLIDALPDQIFVKDTGGRLVLYNQADAKAMRLTSTDEALGKTVYDMYPRELADAYFADDMAVIESGQPLIGREERGLTEDGQERWVLTTKVPLRDRAGHSLGLVGIARDITQRKQIELTLQESEERFRRFSEATTEGLTFHDKGVILDANPAIVALFGFATADELIGRNLLEFVVPEARPLVLQKMQLDDVHPYEVQCIRKDDSLFPAETSTRVYRYGERTIRATAVRDITVRKQLEDRIRESLARRGAQVETSVQVAQALATAADLNELLQRVVELIKERFGYYHAQIFRYDPAQDAVVLVTGYGAAGAAMLAAGHRLPMGHGVVGSAAQTEQPILASDVTQDEDWHPNPYLPDTQGELAVPIKFQDQVLGILDVQSDQAGQLNEDDRLLLTGLCGQIASAMENTRRLEQLRQNEAMLSEALKIAKLAYWEYDVTQDRFLFNDQFYALFHTTVEQVGSYQISSAQYAGTFVHPDDLPIVGAEIERALNSTERRYSRDLVHRIRYADGSSGYISVNINIDRDENGQILRYYGANQDVTERRLAEAQLEELLGSVRESERLMRTVIDATSDWIFIKDQEHRYRLVNQGYANSLHIPTEDFIGKNDLDLGFPEDLVKGNAEKGIAGFWADDRAVMDSGQPRIIPKDLVMIDGALRTYSTIKTPLRDRAGRVRGVLAFARDITDLQKAQEDLLARNTQLAAFNKLGQSLAQLLTTEEVVEHVFQTVGEVLDNRNFYIALYNQRTQDITFPIYTIDGERRKVAGRPVGNGMTEYILRSKQPLLIARDVQNVADSLGIANIGRSAQCYLGIPLLSGDVALGVMTVQDYEHENVYSETDVELLSAIATRMVGALENVRLYSIESQRALQLQTASEVSRAASSLLNLDDLLSQTAELIRTRFELYYVGIFLLDDTERWAVLRAGTGEAGQRMLADNHRLKVGGNSMIGECVTAQRARIALDVGEAATRFNNPLLPLTRSEMALPLISRGRVIGATTIQSDQPAAFATDDITVLQSMADQISNAVENARLYEQAQAALREVDAINRRLTGEAWASYLRQHAGHDVLWLADDAAIAPPTVLEADEQISAGEITLEPEPDGEEATVTVPILLRGQPIGALRLRALLREWDDDTRLMLADIAGHIAQAVENARLVEQTQRAAERERLINEINARVRQSVDLDAILRTAVNELGQSLKAARVMARVGTTIAGGAGDGRGEMND
jgi:PAS domain S-box-containing protein